MYFVYKSNAEIDEYGDVMFKNEGTRSCFYFKRELVTWYYQHFFPI